jgi:hypothetical protein
VDRPMCSLRGPSELLKENLSYFQNLREHH